MFAQKLLLPAFAVLGAVAAQSASICSQATATINSQADATQYASCTTISGDVLIGPDASGAISLDGPEQIKGNFICHNAGQLNSLGSTTISTIGGTFDLFNLTLMSTLSMSDLSTVNAINWSTLQALSELTFTTVVTKASSVIITNTFLSTLEGIDLQTVGTLNINNNNRLKTFTTSIGNVTQLLNIDSNGEALDLSFPNLIWAANMTLRNVSSISIPSLAVVNGSLGFYGNAFTSLAAPNLTTVGSAATLQGSLAVVDNSELTNLTLPLLKSIGGADQIANNSALYTIGFPTLSFVGGAIDFTGNFSSPNLPDLNNVKGGFNMVSESSISCTTFQSEHSSGVIQGTFNCQSSSGSSSGTGTATGSGASSTATKKSDAGSYGVNGAVAGLSVVGGLLRMLL